jgi:hypothetical protein
VRRYGWSLTAHHDNPSLLHPTIGMVAWVACGLLSVWAAFCAVRFVVTWARKLEGPPRSELGLVAWVLGAGYLNYFAFGSLMRALFTFSL